MLLLQQRRETKLAGKTRDAFPQENVNVIVLQQKSAIASRNLGNYLDDNTLPYERKVWLSYHLLDEQYM